MIFDLETFDTDQSATGSICIVGAGPAGITLALELAGKGIDVVLLESGGESFEAETQSLYDGEVVGDLNTDVASSRLREFGGTSQHWTGLCAPLQPIDFEKRPGVAHSGWPISRVDLDPYYPIAQKYLQLGPFDYDFANWKESLPDPALPLDPGLVGNAIYQQSPPTRFYDVYFDTVKANERIRCYLHANLIDIALADDAVRRCTFSTLGGRKLTVEATHYVIACGGIENARILLNCNTQRPDGIGNENGLVGRYYMDHLNCEVGEILFADGDVDLGLYADFHDVDDTLVSVGLKLPAQTMRDQDLLNNTAFLVPAYENEAFSDDFRNHGWLGFSNIVKAFAQGRVPDRFAENFCNAAEDADDVAIGIYRHLVRKIEDTGQVVSATMRQDAEQSPNPASRVMLTDETDPFGWRRIALDWQIARSDLESLRRTHELIGQAIGAAGLGRVRLGITDPPDLDIVYTGYHHMGTTRMSADPAKGVVDADCRLHSVKNLYMGGSSVFTTAGTANPTLTITALAARLADHLAKVSTAGLAPVRRG